MKQCCITENAVVDMGHRPSQAELPQNDAKDTK